MCVCVRACVCICYWTVNETTEAKPILKSRRLFTKNFYSLKQILFGRTDIEGTNTKFVPPNPDTAPLFVHRNSWQCIKYCGRPNTVELGISVHRLPLALYRGLPVSSLQRLTAAHTIIHTELNRTETNAPAAIHYRLPITFTLHCKQLYPFVTPDIDSYSVMDK
jgi:hypothetical protein